MREYTTSNGGCMTFRFDFPPSDPGSLDGYRALLAFMFEVTVPAGAETVQFEGAARTCVFDGVVASVATSTPLHLSRSPSMIARMGSDDIAVIAYTRGTTRLATRAVVRDIEPGEILILDLSKPAEITTQHMENYSLLISRQRLQAWSDVLMDAHGTVIPRGSFQRMLTSFIQSLVAEAPLMHESESPAIAETALQFIGACLRQAHPRSLETGAGAVTLSRVRDAIERRLSNPELGPQSLMQEFGLSRPTLYRMFEPLGGVIRYITERRLQSAFRIITDPTSPPPRISQMAYEFGFSSATAFGRAFRETFGLTPSDARKLAWRKVPDDKAPNALSADLTRFMRQD